MKKTYYKMSYVPTYSEVKEEIVSVTLNLFTLKLCYTKRV